MGIQRAAATNANHVAQGCSGTRGFADNAVVEMKVGVGQGLASRGRCAMRRRGLFIAGDEEADLAGECDPCWSMNRSQATIMAARADFMSALPRPYSQPSDTVGSKGG